MVKNTLLINFISNCIVIINFYYLLLLQLKQKHQLKQKDIINSIEMKRNGKLKEIGIKNFTGFCFDDIINIKNLYLVNILLDQKLYENILTNHAANKTIYSVKPLSFMFDKVDGYNDEHQYIDEHQN